MAAEKYELQYSFDGKRWSKLYTGNAVSYKHKSLIYNYKYYYRVEHTVIKNGVSILI